jgi:hypothetical protein
MAEARLIEDYRRTLAARLPEQIVEELTDGLEETYRRHRDTGLPPQAAARAALAEFGDPDTLAAAFAASAPARRAARALLRTGPLVGCCWAAALIAARAWQWPVPALARGGLGLMLAAVIALLAATARTGSYRRAQHAATLACLGLITLDAALGAALLLPPAAHGWPAALAVAGGARLTFTARALRRIHAH